MKILYLFVIIFIISCSQTSVFRMEGPDDFLKYTNDKNIKPKGSEIRYLNVDLDTDYVFINFGKWKKYFNKRDKKYRWGRDYKLFNINTNIITSTGFSIRTNINNKYFKTSYEALKDWGDEYLIYVGKWVYVDKFKNEIRAVATTKGRIRVFFEFKDKYTEKIKYRPLKLNQEIEEIKKGIYYGRQEIAIIEWLDKYGYNAYVDLKTGEIKQAKE